MNIEILFTGIKDMSILYTRELVDEAESEFEGVNTYQKTYCGKTYCEDILESITEKIPKINKLEYQQCFGRIANEIFVMLTADNIYTIACTIDTYEEKTARLAIHIESQKQGNINSDDIIEKNDNILEEYDYVLEQLKFEIAFEKLLEISKAVKIYEIIWINTEGK